MAPALFTGIVMLVLVFFGVHLASNAGRGGGAGSSTVEVGGSGRPPTYSAPSTGSGPVDESSARLALDRQVAVDRPSAERLVDSWVPQLSSKKLGLVVRGLTYDHLAVWRDHSAIRARYPDALLLWSADFVSYDRDDFWVTVVPRTAATGAQVNSWCDAQGIGADDCYAKRLTHTGGSAGTTLLRG
ncbi:hypothetical protein [Umezawaea sp.]|uniref:hypothetical protein n=1 Tax=Umezawaea sp. TaxID=1955258 RepID=UPI002ED419B2